MFMRAQEREEVSTDAQNQLLEEDAKKEKEKQKKREKKKERNGSSGGWRTDQRPVQAALS